MTNTRLPSWLRKTLPKGTGINHIYSQMEKDHLHTVCQEANCPNRAECFSKKVATFLVLGKVCTRNCAFCNISTGSAPLPPDPTEGKRIINTANKMGLKHIVITMVTRDDLPDGGACHVADIVATIKKELPTTTVEVLTSDFKGDTKSLITILDQKPDIYNHNVETTFSLSPKIRDIANYDRSLDVLRFAKKNILGHCYIKSGLMVGLGESQEEVFHTIEDLSDAGCDIITIGQYLSPSEKHYPVKRFVPPEEFLKYERFGHTIGVKLMVCGPFVRSSYHAEKLFEALKQ